MSRLLQGVAVPYATPTTIAEIGAGGRRIVYREVFDRFSFTALPERVPLVRAHDRQHPLGWATVEHHDRGLIATLEPIDGSVAASDGVAEVKAGVMVGLSIGFVPDPGADQVDDRDRHQLPLVRRRGANLRELSLVGEAAYADARITSTDLDADQHRASEAIMRPVREQRAAEQERQRQADRELAASFAALAARFGSAWQSDQNGPGEGITLGAAPDGSQRATRTEARLFRVGGILLRVAGTRTSAEAGVLAQHAYSRWQVWGYEPDDPRVEIVSR